MISLPRYRLVACSVFTRELCSFVARSHRVVDPEFLEVAAHENSVRLRGRVQDAIDRADTEGYAAVLLGYGLCGNGLAGVRARSVPLVLPRAHDCCSILLGGSAAFQREFGEALSTPWTSVGYLERSADYIRRSDSGKSNGFGLERAELVLKYGEDNAAYLWETLHPELEEKERIFIELEESAPLGRAELVRRETEAEGKGFRVVEGDASVLRSLVDGPWDDARFLTVPPGGEISALYDFEKVMEAK